MPVLHDLICSNERCEDIERDQLSTRKGERCSKCKRGVLEVYYGNWGRNRDAQFASKDAVVVYEHPTTGKIIHPGRNDEPMAERYRAQGYRRREMRSLSEIDSFSKKHGLVNEAAHYDRGSGHSYDK